jgi:hypothetical protein
MIFGFTFTSKKGKGDLCRKKTTGFTLMLTKKTKDWRKKRAGKRGDGSFITCRSNCFTTTEIETATAVYLSKPEESPTQISVGGNPEAEGDVFDNRNEKGL